MSRNPIARPFVVSLILCGAAALAGCQGGTEPQTPPVFKGVVEPRGLYLRFSLYAKIDPVRGVDEAFVGWLRWSDDASREESARLPLVVWTDVEDGHFSADGRAPRTEGEVGKFDLYLGRKPDVVVTCRSADGKTGTADVNGEHFDLANGWLILVKTRGGPARIRQLKREGIKLAPQPSVLSKAFEALSRDPEIVAFFGPDK